MVNPALHQVFGPDVILCGWLGSKHQLTNKIPTILSGVRSCPMLPQWHKNDPVVLPKVQVAGYTKIRISPLSRKSEWPHLLLLCRWSTSSRSICSHEVQKSVIRIVNVKKNHFVWPWFALYSAEMIAHFHTQANFTHVRIGGHTTMNFSGDTCDRRKIACV